MGSDVYAWVVFGLFINIPDSLFWRVVRVPDGPAAGRNEKSPVKTGLKTETKVIYWCLEVLISQGLWA